MGSCLAQNYKTNKVWMKMSNFKDLIKNIIKANCKNYKLLALHHNMPYRSKTTYKY